MLLFKPEHTDLILSGRKVQTRRLGKRRWKVGSVHGCYTRPPFAKGGAEPFCRVRILDVRQERLCGVSSRDAKAEGYEDGEAFVRAFWRINGLEPRDASKGPLDAQVGLDPSVWVVTFDVVTP